MYTTSSWCYPGRPGRSAATSFSKFLLVLLLVALFSWPSAAQLQASSTGNVKVHVLCSDGRPLTSHARLQLMNGSSNNSVVETYTDEHGEAEFSGVSLGTYHILVSGEGIREGDSGTFGVDVRKA